jgi:hypothetical protein
MKMLRVNDRLIIVDGRDPLQYVDLATRKLYKYPAHIDEASEWPVYKWWRNPIKWRQWRRVMKIAKFDMVIKVAQSTSTRNEN